MKINDLYEKLEEFPTILNFEDEICFIKFINKANMDDIQTNFDKFSEILSHILESHQDNGIFEMSDKDFPIFQQYLERLRIFQEKLGIDLSRYTDGFEVNFDESEQGRSYVKQVTSKHKNSKYWSSFRFG